MTLVTRDGRISFKAGRTFFREARSRIAKLRELQAQPYTRDGQTISRDEWSAGFWRNCRELLHACIGRSLVKTRSPAAQSQATIWLDTNAQVSCPYLGPSWVRGSISKASQRAALAPAGAGGAEAS